MKELINQEKGLFQNLYHGTVVTKEADLSVYQGEAGVNAIVGHDRQQAYLANYNQLEANYAGGVEFQLRKEMVILCPLTVDYLYQSFTPIQTSYNWGSRPILEKVVKSLLNGISSKKECALAIMRFCRDLYKKRTLYDITDQNYIFGGTEEQLIEKGEELCECLGRLFVALCDIAGIPGRIVMHAIGGHIAAEVFLDNHWAYIDPRTGVYFTRPNGTLASLWELWTSPELMANQPDHVIADISPRWTLEFRMNACLHKFFHPLEINGFENYSLNESSKYGYHQVTQQQASDLGMWDINHSYITLIKRIFNLD